MRSLVVKVVDVFSESQSQASVVQEPAPADHLGFDRPDPALGEGVAVGTAGRDLDRLDAGILEDALPGIAEISISIVDQVAAADLLQPPTLGGRFSSDLRHIGLVGMPGDAQDLDLPGSQVDAEEDVVGLWPVLGVHLGHSMTEVTEIYAHLAAYDADINKMVGDEPGAVPVAGSPLKLVK